MKIPENKLKVFTKQIYNHIIDEYGQNVNLLPSEVYNMISNRRDDILNLLTSKMDPDTKRAISFMVYLFSENKNLDESVKYVLDNYTYMDVIHFDNFDFKLIECPECRGRGNESCDRCDGRGEEDCDRCNGNGVIECPDCNGSGEDSEGETCYNCNGDGEVECPDCDGNGSFTCSDCGGDGELDCSYCDGNGDVESTHKYFDKYTGMIASISPDVRNLPNDTILTDEQADTLLNSKIISRMDLDDSQVDEYDPMSYKGDGSGTDMWVIEYKEIGL